MKYPHLREKAAGLPPDSFFFMDFSVFLETGRSQPIFTVAMAKGAISKDTVLPSTAHSPRI